MESTCQDKKFQSSWKLPPSSVDLDRRDSPVNPYHRSVRAKMTRPKWTLPDDQSEAEINGLPEFECDTYGNSCMYACSCCTFSEETTDVRRRGYCKKERLRKEAYRKIKAKVENAVKVIFLDLDK